MSNNVQHPQHYNAHPAGMECIEIIRHYVCDIANAIKYLWRAGLKPEQGMDDAEKEIEDLKKALFYIEDYRKNMPKTETILIPYGKQFFKETTGYELDDVIAPYNEYVSLAIHCLCYLGIVRGGRVFAIEKCNTYIDNAKEAIRQRILAIEAARTEKGNGTAEAEMTTERNNQPACIVTVGSHYLSLLCAQQQADPDTVLDRMADHLAANVAGMTSRDWYRVRMSDTGQTVQSYLVVHNPNGDPTAAALYSEDGHLLRQFRINK